MKKMNALMQAGTGLLMAVFFLSACSGSNDTAEIDRIKNETIAVHDEIMPQISSFDRQVIKIDSVMISMEDMIAQNPSLDTAQIREDLAALKGKLEGATDSMMEWMMEFEVEHEGKSNDEIKAYYEAELTKVTQMKTVFDQVSKESADLLSSY